MTWHYRCPDCGHRVQVEWSRMQEEKRCPTCNKTHFPPTPGEDHNAYVATDRIPDDMRAAVVSLRGTTGSIPGCFHEYTDLVHKIPSSKGGQTCVENLLPMCHEHARSKGQSTLLGLLNNGWIASWRNGKINTGIGDGSYLARGKDRADSQGHFRKFLFDDKSSVQGNRSPKG